MTRTIQTQIAIALTLAATAAAPTLAEGWQDQAIAPVTNPIFFETPLIQSEVRPIFIQHRLDSGLLGGPVDVRVYAVQLRYAVTDRLAIIATKDGFIEIDPKNGKGSDGWANLAAGVKYALVKNDEQQFVLTPGVTVELPTGNRDVFQGTGDGDLNLFVSAIKGWDNLHLSGTVGGRIPFNGNEGNYNLRYSGMLDYWVCKWFVPYVSYNAFMTVGDAKAIGLASEGFDLINFGSSNASGRNQGAVGVGFRSRLRENLDLGFGFEYGVVGRDDIFKNRFTVDLIWRF